MLRDISNDHRSRTNDRSIADSYPRQNTRSSSNQYALPHTDIAAERSARSYMGEITHSALVIDDGAMIHDDASADMCQRPNYGSRS
ncbi:hypothetical protein QV13_20580 [Mesorhizobium hungaricum]|uniref:Uncharacterized protein n=1 Tax=Mesorhizobium hungaricum TaxID=1566387 RepID=A0A1C2DJ66_9HYPH|nr:hypothetical protein QV13_20580 [Mesorhizobium hungaricum]